MGLMPLLLIATGLSAPTFAEFGLLAPYDTTKDRAKTYPESKFGAPPPRATSKEIRDIGSHQDPRAFGRRFVTMDNEEGSTSGQRGLASLGTPDTSTTQSDELAPRLLGTAQETSVIATESGFFPKVIFATKGQSIKLFVTASSKAPLCFMSDDFQVRKQVRAGSIEELQITPNRAGTYRFYCPIHQLEGRLVVREPTFRDIASQKNHE